MKRLFSIVFLILVLLTQKVYAIEPTTEFYVNDYANILSSETEKFIFDNSVNLANKTTAQIVVITVPSLEGKSLEEYATDTFRKFGIGDKEKNNGLLILIALEERKCRIEVGYGLEDTLTDGKTGRIQDDYMIPYFKDNNFDEGILNGYKALYKEIAEKYNMETDISPTSVNSEGNDILLGMTAAILVGKIMYEIILLGFDLETKGKLINFLILEALTAIITLGSCFSGANLDSLWLLGVGTIINIIAVCIHIDTSSYSGGGGYGGGYHSSGHHSSGGYHGGGGRSGGGGSSRGF